MQTPPPNDILKIESSKNGDLTRITVYRNQKQMLTFEAAVTNEKCKELLDAIADYIGRYYTTDCKRVSVYNGDAEYFFELNPVDMRVYNSAYGLTKSEPRVSLFVGYPNPKRKKGVSKIYISGTKKAGYRRIVCVYSRLFSQNARFNAGKFIGNRPGVLL